MECIRCRLDAWILTRYAAWSEPTSDTTAKARLHIPKDLSEGIDEDAMDEEIRESLSRTSKIREDYLELVCDATLTWGLANEMRMGKNPADMAFASALTQCRQKNQRLVDATRRLYVSSPDKSDEDTYEQFLLTLATAMVDNTRGYGA